MTSLAAAGLRIDALTEHRVLPWQGPTWWEHVEGTSDWTRLPPSLDGNMPLSYTLQATKEPQP